MFGLGVLGSLGTVPGNSGPSFDPAAAAFFARIPAQTLTRYALLNTVFVGLRAAGILSLLDCLWLMAAADSTTARTNLISSSFTLTPVASPAFTADRGYMLDGTSSYLDSNFNPVAANGKYQRLSAHMGLYSRTNTLGGLDIGARISGSSTQAAIGIQPAAGTYLQRVNVESNSNVLGGPSTSLGHFVGARNGASSNPYYFNGALVSDPATAASAAIPNLNFYVGAFNSNGTPGFSAARQYAASHMGALLTAPQVASLYSIIQAYMTGVGAQV